MFSFTVASLRRWLGLGNGDGSGSGKGSRDGDVEVMDTQCPQCPKCGCAQVHRSGMRTTKEGKKQRWICNGCGKTFYCAGEVGVCV